MLIKNQRAVAQDIHPDQSIEMLISIETETIDRREGERKGRSICERWILNADPEHISFRLPFLERGYQWPLTQGLKAETLSKVVTNCAGSGPGVDKSRSIYAIEIGCRRWSEDFDG